MKTRQYHVLIVGCGMAGMGAADLLSGHGLDLLVIDENVHAGGQLIRKVSRNASFFRCLEPNATKKKGFALARRMGRLERIQAQVLGCFDENTLVLHTGGDRGGATRVVQGEHLVFATGARERFLPFKGWDLPGVISLGAAQILMKSQGILPARELTIAGTSPLMMVLATELTRNGGRVTALLDENHLKKKLSLLPLVRHHWSKLLEGGFHMGGMVLNRTPIHQGIRIVEARGRDTLETVIAASTNARGEVIPGTEKALPAHCLATGYGFVPNIELPVQAGCRIIHSRDRGGWVVRVEEGLATSLPGIYAAGEITGIAGAEKSLVEGRMAALSILDRYGVQKIRGDLGKSRDLQQQMKKLQNRQKKQLAYGAFVNALCRVPSGAYAAIPDDTLICRCEAISMGEIKKSIRQGAFTAAGVKKATRCSMGRCQGRICGPVITDIIAALTHTPPEKSGTTRSRFPVKNVRLAALAQMENMTESTEEKN